MDLKKIFSENIKFLRKKKGMTQRNLAEKLNYSEKAVAKWESGFAMPTIDTLYVLSKTFDCSVDYFFGIHNEIYYLGIDGGASSTKYSLADKNGNIISRYTNEGCNPNDYGYEKTIEVLKNGIKVTCDKISYDSVVLYAGISGLKTCAKKDDIIQGISKLNFKKIYFKGDVDNALMTGLNSSDGIVTIIGTGISVVQRKQSKVNFFGGWGYLIDNGGSGYNIGLDALKKYFESLDGVGYKSKLFNMIEEESKLSGRDLCYEIYKKGKRFVASFAKDVIKIAAEGDELAVEIVNRNIEEASKLILLAAKGFEKDVKIALTGSIAESDMFSNGLIKSLNRYGGYTNVSKISVSLADGAVSMAMKLFSGVGN